MRCPRVRQLELPPRARRILLAGLGEQNFGGTTSACAENTVSKSSRVFFSRNYLRVRGEYYPPPPHHHRRCELPPRARRILHIIPVDSDGFGTTSACAENTIMIDPYIALNRNYLRVRGEYKPYQYGGTGNPELPPRARRIQTSRFQLCACKGTTSACAENTFPESGRNPHARNYLRVRGEYPATGGSPATGGELPPRARRILPDGYRRGEAFGTTSACAENT